MFVQLVALSIDCHVQKIIIKKQHFSSSKPKTAQMMSLDRIEQMLYNIDLHTCSGYFTQVSETWPVGHMFSYSVHREIKNLQAFLAHLSKDQGELL